MVTSQFVSSMPAAVSLPTETVPVLLILNNPLPVVSVPPALMLIAPPVTEMTPVKEMSPPRNTSRPIYQRQAPPPGPSCKTPSKSNVPAPSHVSVAGVGPGVSVRWVNRPRRLGCKTAHRHTVAVEAEDAGAGSAERHGIGRLEFSAPGWSSRTEPPLIVTPPVNVLLSLSAS